MKLTRPCGGSVLVALLFVLLLQVQSPLVKCFALNSRHNSKRSRRLNGSHTCMRQWQRQRGGDDSSSFRSATISNLHHNINRNRRNVVPSSALWTKVPGTDESSSSDYGNNEQAKGIKPAFWPCWDALDLRLIKIALPVIANFAINPLIGAVDLFWVNRMRNALAVAGQGAANQVFDSAFFVASFLPSITATLISKENAKNNREGVQDAVCDALFVGVFMALAANAFLFLYPTKALGAVLKQGVPAMEYAMPYLSVRAFAFIPSLISLVGFAAFRGVQDTLTPVKISLSANVINVILDPILIFWASMGVKGAAIATLIAEVISAIIYLIVLRKREMISFSKLFRSPAWKKLGNLLKGGSALQLRNVALNVSLIAVQRVAQRIDTTGVAAAAHSMAIQVFRLGGIVLLALSTVAQTVIPNDLVQVYDQKQKRMIGGIENAKNTAHRLLSWGIILGVALGLVQLLALPLIQKSTPLQEVRDAAKIPGILASVFQSINGLVFIGEGIMVGTESFFMLSLHTIAATAGCLGALRLFADRYGVAGVWMGLGVFNIIRLIGVSLHLRVYGPLSPKKTKK
ncbi:hypothetical protein ACA910_015915 [Epithemia clementina (nom. ined.)]